jgi:hypothetical protein
MANGLRHDLIKGCLSASGWLARSRHWTEEGGIPPFSESRRRGSTVRVRQRALQNRSTSGWLSRSDRLATRRLSSAYGAVHVGLPPQGQDRVLRHLGHHRHRGRQPHIRTERRQQQTAATVSPSGVRDRPTSTSWPAQMTLIDLPATSSHRGDQSLARHRA